jgi:hypothetical protein
MIAILASGAGALLAWASTVQDLPTPPADSVIRELDAWDAPPPLPYVWSPTALDWVVPADPTRKLTRLEFRWRYTLAEQVAVEVAEREHADATVRATLAILRMSLAEATEIDVTDPRTVQGVQYHASIGLIAPTRVAEILAAP